MALTGRKGFTLIELLVVLAILATLLTLAMPKYFDSVERAKEAALRTNLRVIREAIDKHLGDTGQLPLTLDTLATARYLREVPKDPIMDSREAWVLSPSPDGIAPGVYDVHSGAKGLARDGTAYASW